MTVAWSDFLLIPLAVAELFAAIDGLHEGRKEHNDVRIAAEKYRSVFENPDCAKLMANARTGLKIFK